MWFTHRQSGQLFSFFVFPTNILFVILFQVIRAVAYNCQNLKHFALKCTRPKSSKNLEIASGLYVLRNLQTFCFDRFQPNLPKSCKKPRIFSSAESTQKTPVLPQPEVIDFNRIITANQQQLEV